MPHRIFLNWLSNYDSAVTLVVGGLSSLFMWAMNADGWIVAMAGLGVGGGILLTKLSGPLSEMILKVGKAWVDVLAYKKQMLREAVPTLIETKTVATEALAATVENKSGIKNLMQAQRDREQEVIDLKAELVEYKRKLAQYAEGSELRREGSEKERDIVHGAAMLVRSETKDNSAQIRELKAQLAVLMGRSNDPDREVVQ